MPTVIQDGTGNAYDAKVDSNNRLFVDAAISSGVISAEISGGIHIGSVSANVDAVYIQSGANMVGSAYVYQKTDPWVVSGNVLSSVSGTGLEDFSLRLTQRMDFDGTQQPVYLGFAPPGTATSTAGWLLKKITYDGLNATAIEFGSGNLNFDKVWDSRSGTDEEYS